MVYILVCTEFMEPQNGRPLVERLFLREKRLSDAQGRGLCEANAGHVPREVVCSGREGSGIPSIDKAACDFPRVTPEKGASNLQPNFHFSLVHELAFLNLLHRAI